MVGCRFTFTLSRTLYLFSPKFCLSAMTFKSRVLPYTCRRGVLLYMCHVAKLLLHTYTLSLSHVQVLLMLGVPLYISNQDNIFHLRIFLCSTSLNLASTRWVQSTLSSLCPLSSKQCHRQISAASTEIVWELWELNPGLLGEKQECYLCAMQPPRWRNVCGAGQQKMKQYFIFDFFAVAEVDRLCVPRLISILRS